MSDPTKINKTIRDIRKENYDADKTLKDIRSTLDPEEDHYKPIKTVNDFNNNYIEFESIGDKEKTLSIKPHLINIINDHKTQGEWKIRLTIAINFISSRDSDETWNMHSKSDNIEIMIGNETDEIIVVLFDSLLQRYQEKLEQSMRGSEFVFDSVDLLYYNLNKTCLVRDGSYTDPPKW